MRIFQNFLKRVPLLFNGARVILRSAHDIPELPYHPACLEPVLEEALVKQHFCKHIKYVHKLNAIEETLKKAIECEDPETLITASMECRHYGGAHLNHTIYWNSFTKEENSPSPCLLRYIVKSFGSVEQCKQSLLEACLSIRGSGWGWLAVDISTNRMQAVTTPDEESLETTPFLRPLIGVDMWEHAYYYQYEIDKRKYVCDLLDLINWDSVYERLKMVMVDQEECSPAPPKKPKC